MPETQIQNSDIVVGQNIAARRRAFGWSRAKLADLLGRDDSWVRRVEEGQKLSPEEFYEVAEELKISEPKMLLQPNCFF